MMIAEEDETIRFKSNYPPNSEWRYLSNLADRAFSAEIAGLVPAKRDTLAVAEEFRCGYDVFTLQPMDGSSSSRHNVWRLPTRCRQSRRAPP